MPREKKGPISFDALPETLQKIWALLIGHQSPEVRAQLLDDVGRDYAGADPATLSLLAKLVRTIEQRTPQQQESPGQELIRSIAWRSGYDRGVKDTLRALAQDPEGLLARSKPMVEREKAAEQNSALIEAIKGKDTPQDPAAKAAGTRRLRRVFRDEGQAIELARLVTSGDTTETARAKMKIGAVKAKRLRAIAVRLQLIRPRQRKP